VRTALALLSARPSRARAIVLLSDGEDLDAGLRDAAAECRRRGVALDTVASGTEAGAAVPSRNGGILTEGGSPVVSRARPGDLAALARESGGRFASTGAASGAAGLAASFAGKTAAGRGTPVREPVSRSAWPLAGAVAAWAGWWTPRRESRREES
jgi:hypothetical protein